MKSKLEIIKENVYIKLNKQELINNQYQTLIIGFIEKLNLSDKKLPRDKINLLGLIASNLSKNDDNIKCEFGINEEYVYLEGVPFSKNAKIDIDNYSNLLKKTILYLEGIIITPTIKERDFSNLIENYLLNKTDLTKFSKNKIVEKSRIIMIGKDIKNLEKYEVIKSDSKNNGNLISHIEEALK